MNGVQLSKEAIALFAKQKRAQTSRRENQEETKKKEFDKQMKRRKEKIGMMPRTVFDFKMHQPLPKDEENYYQTNPTYTQIQMDRNLRLSYQQP